MDPKKWQLSDSLHSAREQRAKATTRGQIFRAEALIKTLVAELVQHDSDVRNHREVPS